MDQTPEKGKIKSVFSSLLSGGFFHILCGGTLNKMLAFISSIVIIRLVAKADYAALAYVDNIYSYVIMISGLGMSSAVLKYCVTDDDAKATAYFGFALKYGTIVQLGCGLIAYVISLLLDVPFEKTKPLFLLLFFYPVLYFILNTFYSFVRAKSLNAQYARASVIQTSLLLVCSIGLVLLIGVFGIAFSRYIAIIVTTTYCAYHIKKNVPIKRGYTLTFDEKKAFIVLGISMLVANMFSMIMPSNEAFLINNLLKSSTITADYKVAYLIPEQLIFIPQVIMIYYFPKFARIEGEKSLWKNASRVGAFGGLITLSAGVIGIIITPFVISVFYGDKYSGINMLFSFMWIVQIINGAIRVIPMNILPAIGITRYNMMNSIISCGAHLGLAALLIIKIGVYGGIIASAIVYFVSGIHYWIYLYKHCKEKALESEN